MSDKDIICTLVKKYDEKPTRNGTIRIQIVRWGKYKPVLEKREFWTDQEGQEKTGKAKGFNAEDFELLIQNSSGIKDLLSKE